MLGFERKKDASRSAPTYTNLYEDIGWGYGPAAGEPMAWYLGDRLDGGGPVRLPWRECSYGLSVEATFLSQAMVAMPGLIRDLLDMNTSAAALVLDPRKELVSLATSGDDARTRVVSSPAEIEEALRAVGSEIAERRSARSPVSMAPALVVVTIDPQAVAESVRFDAESQRVGTAAHALRLIYTAGSSAGVLRLTFARFGDFSSELAVNAGRYVCADAPSAIHARGSSWPYRQELVDRKDILWIAGLFPVVRRGA